MKTMRVSGFRVAQGGHGFYQRVVDIGEPGRNLSPAVVMFLGSPVLLAGRLLGIQLGVLPDPPDVRAPDLVGVR